jgi:polyvinyl alcohol dehydrogenase (cytochrome)
MTSKVILMLGASSLLAPATLARGPKCARLCRDVIAECRTGCTQPAKIACVPACRRKAVAVCKAQPEPRSNCLGEDRWAMLAQNVASTYTNAAERTLSIANVGQLELDWRFGPRSIVNGAAAVVDGVAYVLSGASLYALDLASRTVRWENRDLAGTSSPTFDGGTLFVQTANADVVALDPATGVEHWRAAVDPLAFGWGSPVVFERFVIVGIASADLTSNASFRGGMVAFDRNTGAELWRFRTADAPSNGVSVWSTPSVDVEARVVYGSTGNNYTGEPGPTSDAIFALDVDTGALRWLTQLTEGDVFTIGAASGPDFDFGTNPILFEAMVDGHLRKLVAAGQKSGAMWALDRKTGEVVWSQSVSPGSSLIGGVFNNGAYDGERILAVGNNGTSSAPGGEPTVPPNQGHARLVALDPSTGAILWERQVGGWVWAPITVANGVGFVAVDTILEAFDVRTGAKLFTFSAAGTITSAPVVGGGKLHFGAGLSYFVGTRARDFYVLSLDGRGGGGGSSGSGATFSAIYDDIIVGEGCSAAFCHGSSASGNLRMETRDGAYANLVNVAAAGEACAGSGLRRVDPGDADKSLLYHKVNDPAPPCGGRMPPTGPLSEESIARIRDWIVNGAPND